MVLTRAERAAADAEERIQFELAVKLSLATNPGSKRRRSRNTGTTSSGSSPRTPKKKNLNGVTKRSSSDAGSVPKRRRLKITLSFDYRRIPYERIRKLNIRALVRPRDYWPYRQHRLKLGHNPWEHHNWVGPTQAAVRRVHKLLADYHKQFEFERYVDMPAHAAQSAVNVDMVIQTIFAQSTGNESAIDTHSRLCNTFPYLVDGQKYVGKVPNWHEVRHLPREELQTVLEQGGFQTSRATCVQELLNSVYEINCMRREKGVQQFECDANPPEAKDFVPGMLSLEYLTDQEDNSDKALLGRLLNIRGVGPKSAMCILAFGFKRQLFVVDTHVLRYCKWLGWIPNECNNINDAAMFLHNYIPDDIKYDLHNQIWTHCANENVRRSRTRTVICAVCGSIPPAKSRDISEFIESCPLKDLLPSLDKRWGARYSIRETESVKDQPEEPGGPDDRELGTSNGDLVDDISETIAMSIDESVEESALSQLEQATVTSVTSLDSTPEMGSSSSSEEEKSQEETASTEQNTEQAKPVKTRKLNLKLKSIRFEDVSEDQFEELQNAGYLLWEFRPMDNTFMEEWGKFDQFPRYKWERPDVMDKDVAVSYQYAKDVLAGKQKHKWSKVDAEDVAAAQAISTMTA